MIIDFVLVILLAVCILVLLYVYSHRKRKASSEKTESTRALARNKSPLSKNVSVALIALTIFVYFGNKVSWFGAFDNQTHEKENQSTTATIGQDSLVIELSKTNLGMPVCSSAFCGFYSVRLTNIGTSPVELYDDICLVADGKTFRENFGHMITGTLNPGEYFLEFDAAFRPENDSHVTEIYVGDCISGKRQASLSLDYYASE